MSGRSYIKTGGNRIKPTKQAVEKYYKELKKSSMDKRGRNGHSYRDRFDNFMLRSRESINKIISALMHR